MNEVIAFFGLDELALTLSIFLFIYRLCFMHDVGTNENEIYKENSAVFWTWPNKNLEHFVYSNNPIKQKKTFFFVMLCWLFQSIRIYENSKNKILQRSLFSTVFIKKNRKFFFWKHVFTRFFLHVKLEKTQNHFCRKSGIILLKNYVNRRCSFLDAFTVFHSIINSM